MCFSGCKTSFLCLKYVQILWNSTLTNSINSGKSGPEASNVVSSAKRKSLSKEFSGRSLMYNKSIFSLFFTFFRFFSLNFRFTSIFSLNFRLFYLRFRFRFLVFRIEVNHVKSGFFFASKRNEIFASISNFASEAKVRAHPTLHPHLPRPIAWSSGRAPPLGAHGVEVALLRASPTPGSAAPCQK